jgi:hypothetical protein
MQVISGTPHQVNKTHGMRLCNADPPLLAFLAYVAWGFGCQMLGISEVWGEVVALAIVVCGIVIGAWMIAFASLGQTARRRFILEEILLLVVLGPAIYLAM